MDYACDLKIGWIEFNIGEKQPSIEEDSAVFDNVEATIYPVGSYKAEIK